MWLLAPGAIRERGGRLSVTSTSVVVMARHLPVRIRNGTPSQRHDATPQLHRGVRLDRGPGRHPGLLPIPLELAAHQMIGSERADPAEDLDLLVADGLR